MKRGPALKLCLCLNLLGLKVRLEEGELYHLVSEDLPMQVDHQMSFYENDRIVYLQDPDGFWCWCKPFQVVLDNQITSQ